MTRPATAADLGLMHGYPPSPEARVTRANLFFPPYNRWSFQHMRELMPSTRVSRGSGPARQLGEAKRDFSGLRYDLADGSSGDLDTLLDTAYTDALVVLHRGQIVMEEYLNGMGPDSLHQMMSVTKSFTGTLLLQAAQMGLVDLAAPVVQYIPELAGTAWDTASVQNAVDMTTGVEFEEVYDDANASFQQYAIGAGFTLAPEGYQGAHTAFDALLSMRELGTHGDTFHYVTPNTEVAGLVLARATGAGFAAWCSNAIWQRIGAEHDAYILVDSVGTQLAGAGLNATARDLARVGQMLLDGGRVGEVQVLAPEVVQTIVAGGDRDVFARGVPVEPGMAYHGWSYRNCWWYTHNDHAAFTGIGINGQWLYVDPAAEMVLVMQSSNPVADDGVVDDVILRAFHAIAQELRST